MAYIEPVWEVIAPPCPIEGVWDRRGTGDVHSGPGWATAREALDWSWERAPVVLFRVQERIFSFRDIIGGELVFRLYAPVEEISVLYSVGEVDADAEDVVRVAPPPALTRRIERVSDYGGFVHLLQPHAGEIGDPVGYEVRWEVMGNGAQVVAETAGPAWEGDIAGAIAWARSRAPYVLVCDGPPRFGYTSAGELDPPGLDMPRTPFDDQTCDVSPPPPSERSTRLVIHEVRSKQFPLGRPAPRGGWGFPA